jgi:hypothetical protein
MRNGSCARRIRAAGGKCLKQRLAAEEGAAVVASRLPHTQSSSIDMISTPSAAKELSNRPRTAAA